MKSLMFAIIGLLAAGASAVPCGVEHALLNVAHRGLWKESHLPQNTVESIKAAYDAGATIVETDFVETKSGEIICLHDRNALASMSTVVKDPAEITAADRAVINLGEKMGLPRPYRIPLLGDVLAVVPKDRMVQAEIKGYGPTYARQFDAAVRASGLCETNVLVSSFDHGALKDFHGKYPKYRTLWLGCGITGKGFDLVDVIARAKDSGFDIVCPGCADARKAGFGRADADRIRAAGFDFRVYGVNDESLLKYAAGLGATGFTCNYFKTAYGWARHLGNVKLLPELEARESPGGGRKTICLGGEGWTCDDEPVSVPHTWNATDACDGPRPEVVANPKLDNGGSAGGTGYLRKRAVYRRALPAPKAGRRAFLRFEGASIVADVFVNGERVGGHKGSFTAFGCEITRFLKPDGNLLEVEVDNRRDFSTQPMSADYSVYGGLYRDVWLVETDPVCIDPIADGADGVKVNADASTGEVSVEVQVSGGTNEVQRFRVANHELWSPENPKLYTRTVRVAQKGSVDAVDVRFGFRTVEFRDGQFYLNGQKRQLRGVNRHQDRAGKGWAVSRADEEEDIRLIKEMGADALRTAHYPNSHHIYDLCDELGLVCWVEYPNVNRLTFTDEFESGMRRQVREMIVQNRNHPCVAVWSMFNELGNGEGWMDWKAVVAMMGRTCDYVRRLDPTRRVTGVMGETGERDLNVLPDEYGLNVYPKWYNARDMREMLDWVMAESGRRTVAITEYGVGASVSHHGDPAVAVPAGGGFHPEEYQAYRMHDNYLRMKRDARIWGTFVWAMYDFGADNRTEGDRHGINDKGIITHDRKTKKDVYWLYRANWTKDPVLHLVGSRMTSTTNGVLSVMGFSNVGAVLLTVNGRPFGERMPDDACGVLWQDVELKPGENRIELRSGDRTASAVWTRVSGGNG